jgi:hypothetical protein
VTTALFVSIPTCLTDFRELLIWRTGCLVKLLSRIKDLRFTTKNGQPCLEIRLPGHACPHADCPRGPDTEILTQLAPLLQDRPHVDLHVVDVDHAALAALGSGLGPIGGESLGVHLHDLPTDLKDDHSGLWLGLLGELPNLSELHITYRVHRDMNDSR